MPLRNRWCSTANCVATDKPHAQHCYTRLPAGYPRHDAETVTGAVVLTFFDHEPRWRTGDPPAGRYDLSGAEPLLDVRDALECAGMDPVYASSGLRWKMLRGQIGDADTTMLVYCPPHLHRRSGVARRKSMTVSKRCSWISGDYLSNVGTMHEGAAFLATAGHRAWSLRHAQRQSGADPHPGRRAAEQLDVARVRNLRSPPLRPYLPPELSARGKPRQPEAY